MMKTVLLFCLLVVCSEALLWGLVGTEQSAAVTGKLTCNGEPAGGVRVKLYEKETTIDVKLDESVTNKDGSFRLSGTKTEVSTIDPKLNIYHKCNYDGLLSNSCYKKISITIPDTFVTEGKTPNKTFDIGTLNLAGRWGSDDTDCIN